MWRSNRLGCAKKLVRYRVESAPGSYILGLIIKIIRLKIVVFTIESLFVS
ncbi:Uncharacterised protein [Legionella moravica]|uniref:Uncharacterized protein n=1 Tax=Legionella moravica TaxID=39962 RepID=A0A378JZI1_9GAMM|nr:Uncharacterised protein [Legionella moravica]